MVVLQDLFLINLFTLLYKILLNRKKKNIFFTKLFMLGIFCVPARRNHKLTHVKLRAKQCIMGTLISI